MTWPNVLKEQWGWGTQPLFGPVVKMPVWRGVSHILVAVFAVWLWLLVEVPEEADSGRQQVTASVAGLLPLVQGS